MLNASRREDAWRAEPDDGAASEIHPAPPLAEPPSPQQRAGQPSYWKDLRSSTHAYLKDLRSSGESSWRDLRSYLNERPAVGSAAMAIAGGVALLVLRRRVPGLGLGILGAVAGAQTLTDRGSADGISPQPGRYVLAAAAALGGLLFIGGASAATVLTTLTYASIVAACIGCQDRVVGDCVQATLVGTCLLRAKVALAAAPLTAGSWLISGAAIVGCAVAWVGFLVGCADMAGYPDLDD